MTVKENKKYQLLIILLCIGILLPLLIAGIYNRPSADDYDYAVLTHYAVQNGGNIFDILKAAWDTDVNFYNTWQGLYSSAFILSLHPGIWGEALYSLTTIIVILVCWMCLFFSFNILNRHFIGKSRLYSLAASLVILVMLMLWLPSPFGGLYWFNGAMNYMPWAFTNLLNICLLLEASKTNSKKRFVVMVVLSTLLSFLTSGGNHVTAFANILLLLTVVAMQLPKKKFYPIIPFAVACIGFAIMFAAPGTAIRQSLLPAGPGAVKTIIKTALHVYTLAGDWFSFSWILSLLAVTPAAIEFGAANKDKFPKHFPLYILFTVIIAVAVICGMFCVPYYAMADFGMGRVTNVIWITFMFFSWVIYFMLWGLFVNRGYINTEKLFGENYYNLFKTVFVCISLVAITFIINNQLASSSVKAASELVKGIPQSYCKQMDARFEMYNDPDLTLIAVEPITAKSELLFHNDIGTDPDIWPNNIMGDYYGKEIYLNE